MVIEKPKAQILIPTILVILTTGVMSLCFGLGDNIDIKTKKEGLQMSVQLTLNIDLEKKNFKVNKPIVINCELKNNSKEEIILAPILYMSLLIHLEYDDSPVVPFGPKVLLKELIKRENIIKLPPGKIYAFKRIISQETYIMPDKIGPYKLYITYTNKLEQINGIKLWVGEITSNSVTFNIEQDNR